jgi:hypothetical protein
MLQTGVYVYGIYYGIHLKLIRLILYVNINLLKMYSIRLLHFRYELYLMKYKKTNLFIMNTWNATDNYGLM